MGHRTASLVWHGVDVNVAIEIVGVLLVPCQDTANEIELRLLKQWQ